MSAMVWFPPGRSSSSWRAAVASLFAHMRAGIDDGQLFARAPRRFLAIATTTRIFRRADGGRADRRAHPHTCAASATSSARELSPRRQRTAKLGARGRDAGLASADPALPGAAQDRFDLGLGCERGEGRVVELPF